MILSRHIRPVCKSWGVSELQLCNKQKYEKIVSFSKDNNEECEHVTQMIRELSYGIKGFSMTEITDILAYILLINHIVNTKLT